MDCPDDNDEIFVEVGGCQALLEVKANQCVLNVKTRPWTERVPCTERIELSCTESVDDDLGAIKVDEGGESVGSSAYTEVHHPSGYDRVRMSLFVADCRITVSCPLMVLCVPLS